MNGTEVIEDDLIEIPFAKLREDVLIGIMDEFILQEGTDYGMQEYSLEDKRAQVKKQLLDGRAKIIFNQRTETCAIVPAR